MPKRIRIPDARPRHAPQARHTGGTVIAPRFSTRASADLAEINIYDEIGFWGVTAGDVRRALDGISAREIRLRLNSPGGDVWDGLAIYNDLLAHPARVSVEITGIAASIASIIAMAGDRIGIAENGFMMIHNAWTGAFGDRHFLAETAALLGQIDGALAETYAARTGGEVKAMAELMDNETWMTGAAVVDAGFADATLAAGEGEGEGDAGGDAVAALFDLSRFGQVPAVMKRRTEEGLRAAGYSKREARAAIANGFDDLPRRDAAARTSRRDAGAGETALVMGVEALTARIQAAAG